jgi:hypothetical protein
MFISYFHHYFIVFLFHAWIEHYKYFDTQHIAIKSPHNPPYITKFDIC